MADFLDDVFAAEPPVVPEVVEPVKEPEATVEPTPEAVKEPTPEPEVKPEADKGPGYVPIDALLTERERRQAAERERDEFKRQQQPVQPIDPFDNPEGYAEQQRQFVDERINQVRFEMSDRFARQQHGAEATEAATSWAQEKAKADPVFAASYMREPDPIGWIVQQHKRDALLSDIGDSPDDWFSREAAKRGYVAQSAPVVAPVVTPPANKPAIPPRSIASDAAAPSAPQSDNPMASLDAIFSR